MNRLLAPVIRDFVPSLIIVSISVVVLMSFVLSQFVYGIKSYSDKSLLIGGILYVAGLLLSIIARYCKDNSFRGWIYLLSNIITPFILFFVVTIFMNSGFVSIDNSALFVRLFPVICGSLAIVIGLFFFLPTTD